MPWQLQPIIWPIIIATLALLAIPHKAHPGPPVAQSATGTPTAEHEPSAELMQACFRPLWRYCREEVKRLDRKAAGECVKANFNKLEERCRTLIEREFPEVKDAK
jgi:hypothetical protein